MNNNKSRTGTMLSHPFDSICPGIDAINNMDDVVKLMIAGWLMTQLSEFEYQRTGFRELHRIASSGNVIACSIVASCYLEGRGVKPSVRSAVEWLAVAAKAGWPGAQFNLGLCYMEGRNGVVNYSKARHWFSKAAASGLADASCNIGYMHWHGLGVPLSLKEAKRWLLRAFRQGSLLAAFNMGLIYEQAGKKRFSNYILAVKWYGKAASHGHSASQCNLGVMYIEGRGVRKNSNIGRRWLNQAAKAGDIIARRTLKVYQKRKKGRSIHPSPT